MRQIPFRFILYEFGSTSLGMRLIATRPASPLCFAPRETPFGAQGKRDKEVKRRALHGVKKEVPGGVHGGVHDSGGKDGTRFAPSPAVENACDGGQDDITPVGKA